MAEYLIKYNSKEDMYYTSDDNGFYWKCDAIDHEIKWLMQECD